MYLNSTTLTLLFYVASPVSGFHRQFPFTTSLHSCGSVFNFNEGDAGEAIPREDL